MCLIFQVTYDYHFEGGYLDFSHLTELKIDIYHCNLYEKKKKIQIIKNKESLNYRKHIFDGIPYKTT